MKTPKPLESKILFESGHQYSLAIYDFSPESREEYYKNENLGEVVYSENLRSTGSFIDRDLYLICYKEK